MTSELEIKRTLTNDATPLVGKVVFTVNTASTAPTMILKLHPKFLGDRAADFIFIYTYYKIKRIVFRFGSYTNSNTNVPVVLGVLDDIQGEGDTPSTYSDVSELRSSMVHHGQNQPPTELFWEPVDKDLWYKTYDAGSSTAELYESGNTYLAATAATATTTSVEVTYEIVFKGACDVGSLMAKLKREFNLVSKDEPVIVARPPKGEATPVNPDRSGWYGTLQRT
jgi:hypothetical protein